MTATPSVEGAPPGPPPPAPRSQTKELILATALRLFRERGYDETTMRAVAKEAGVSVGNAYYYFDSKEHLVQAFYDQIAAEHRAAVAERLTGVRGLADRLRIVHLTWFEVAAPYHSFAAKFFKVAAEPSSPLSPFSADSAPAREANIALFADVLAGSDAKLDPRLRRELPELLWLHHLGVVLFWVHDRSPDVRRSRMLVERTVPLVDRLVGLSRLRLLRPVTREVVDLLHALRAPDPHPSEGDHAEHVDQLDRPPS